MENWKYQKLLDKYILDYMIKNRRFDTAAIFAKESNVCLEPVAIDCREGFLAEWWEIFWGIYSNKASKHPEAMEGSSSKQVSTVPGLRDSFPYNFQATQNAGNCSQNTLLALSKPSMNPTMGMPGLQDSFPNICQATQKAVLDLPYWQDMLQNPSPATGLPGLPNHPQTLHSTAMPSPDMEEYSQKSTLTITISRPGMVNLPQSGLPRTTRRPDLNPNYFGSPSSMDTDVVEGDLSTNLIATGRHQQEHPSSRKRGHS